MYKKELGKMMNNNEDKYLKLEKQYQDSLESQKRYYESELELLKSKFKYEKEKIKIECENKTLEKEQSLKSFYDVKNVEDLEKQKEYFISELDSQKNWYEEEIKRRCKETENWHIENLKKETERLQKEFQEKYSQMEETLKCTEETLSSHILEQKEYYEKQLKPFKKIIKLKNKLKRKNKKENNKGEQYTLNSSLKSDLTAKADKCPEIKELPDNFKPKISIILPVYNVGKYLRQSLDSLVNQTLKEIEIICVDDGSGDDSYEILEEYKNKDARIKVIHKENKGTGAARNDGLRIASGEYIGFVDPDDWVKPNMYERLYTLAKEKDVDITMCMPDGYDEKNKKETPFPYFVDENFANIPEERIFSWKDLSPFKYPMCVWNKLYKKELFDKNKIEFAEGLDFEDHKVIFGSLLTAEKIYFIKEKLYVYRFNREGSVLTDNNRRLIDHIEIFNIVENILKNTNTYEALREDFLLYKIHNLLYYYSMIKEEFKNEYYENMINSIKETNITEEEMKFLKEKYPELEEIIK